MKVLRGLAVAAAMLISSPSHADIDSGWVERKRNDIADWLFEKDGIRISDCHLQVMSDGDKVESVRPVCYAFNRHLDTARVSVQLLALDAAGDIIMNVTLSTFVPLGTYVGTELASIIPFSSDELKRVSTYRLRAVVRS